MKFLKQAFFCFIFNNFFCCGFIHDTVWGSLRHFISLLGKHSGSNEFFYRRLESLVKCIKSSCKIQLHCLDYFILVGEPQKPSYRDGPNGRHRRSNSISQFVVLHYIVGFSSL